MATSLQTLQTHLPTCESQWQPLCRPYSSTFLPVGLNANLPTDLTAPPSYCESHWQPIYRLYSPTFLPVSLNGNLPADLKATFESQRQPLYRTYGSTFLPLSLNGICNLSTDLTAPSSYLRASMATSLQTLQIHLPTFESQWQPLYIPYNSTFLPVSLNGNFSTYPTAPPS